MLWVAGDGLYASLPLVHKENVTGCHHPYASKPRPAHASSSRERIVDDGDENMSPNHSETNDKPRRALSQIVCSPTLKCPSPRVCLNNARSDSIGTRLTSLKMWQNMHARRSNKDG
ncbi:hypothetical protein O181_058377 [Austropuccinia psidii MF-1]|uniref:Uncharacterized protein n=1 Tax=Austropuccinia psidii MF-1 TaxID=1389203 RepID=A0A9Q3EEI7_9BASI|nr:hypothetical protein [Austropuccinia psidii MF-1]